MGIERPCLLRISRVYRMETGSGEGNRRDLKERRDAKAAKKMNSLLRQTKSYGGQVERRTGLRSEASTRQASNAE
jgi:hypothetical protein